ncbi:MAG: aldo/keto reductase [bacterium]|nr:aldo/keto reductase [bacterium]
MSDYLSERVKLGKTDLMVGRLGLSASYPAPAEALEAAYDAGCNYFYWGALRRAPMTRAVRNIVARGERDNLVVVIQDFRRKPKPFEKSLMRGLKKGGLDYADVLLLGIYNKPPRPGTLDMTEKLREQGAFRYLAISGHKRTLFPEWAKDVRFDIFHVRYNAANRGGDVDLFPHLPEERPGIVAFTTTRNGSLMKSGKIPKEERKPTAGDCYRFALTNPSIDVAITGASNAKQLEQNLSEVARGPMDDEELARMRRIGDCVYGKERDY